MQGEIVRGNTSTPLPSAWVYAFSPLEDVHDLVWARVVAISSVALFHVIIALLWYHAFVTRETVSEAVPVIEAIELELEPELFKGSLIAVPVNPEANQDVPEATSNVAEQNQEAASEQASAEGTSDMPVLDGDQEVLFALKEGQRVLVDKTPSLPMGMPLVSKFKQQGDADQLDVSIIEKQSEKEAQLPLKIAGDYGDRVIVRKDTASPEVDDEGRAISIGLEDSPEGVTVLPSYDNSESSDRAYVMNIQERVDEAVAPANQFDIIEVQPEVPVNIPQGIPVPTPRPAVKPRKNAGPLIKSERKPAKIGKDAVDANFNLMGVYGNRMREVYLSQWDILAETYTFSSQDTGSKVDVHFVLTKEGEIKDFEVVNTTATQGATLLIQDAIQSRAPYEPWTQDMIRVFGDEFGFRLSFYYFRVH